MSPHVSPLSHILREQQGLLHYIGDIANRPTLEIANEGIGKKRFPIQHWSGKPSWRPYLGVASLFGLPLPCFGLFRCFLNLIPLRRKGLPSFHHPFPFLLSFPFQVSWLGRAQGRWRSGRLWTGYLPRCIPPTLILYQFQQIGLRFALNAHLINYWWEVWAEVSDRSL